MRCMSTKLQLCTVQKCWPLCIISLSVAIFTLDSPLGRVREDAEQLPVCVKLESPTINCSLNSPIEYLLVVWGTGNILLRVYSILLPFFLEVVTFQ